MASTSHEAEDGYSNLFDDPEERRVFYAALDSFRQYRQAAHYNITHLRRQSFYSLPSAHVDILSAPPFSLPEKSRAVDEAIDVNADIAEAILDVGLAAYDIDPNDESWQGQATTNDIGKAVSTLKQLYREWSAEGSPERHASFSPILSALQSHFGNVLPAQRHSLNILVPGAGLARLVLDICAAGYTVQGNEISYHQLLASNYILNCTQHAEQHNFFPWAMSFSNNLSRASQLQSISVPDVHPAAALENGDRETRSEVHYSERMSMAAGDFCALYKQAEYKDSFDAVATCFFIDTAPNVISYIETIKHCLKPGGVWINLGPLMWHFESSPTPAERDRQRRQEASDSSAGAEDNVIHGFGHVQPSPGSRNEGIGEPGSFELSCDEIVSLVEHLGFEILKQKQAPAGATGYLQDPQSMFQSVYRPMFWVARKI